jgi:hypothetical protein
MPKTLLALLALLAVAPAAPALAPDGPSGEMALARDQVSEAIRKYRKESDPHRRLALLTDLGEVRDPRVAVMLGEALYDRRSEMRVQAAFAILFHQSGEKVKRMMPAREVLTWAQEWWANHEADARRRARRLP